MRIRKGLERGVVALGVMMGVMWMRGACAVAEGPVEPPGRAEAQAANASVEEARVSEAAKGGVRYRLAEGWEKWDPQIRERIVRAMDEAVAIYNRYGKFDKLVTANYSPGTPTADANINGWINFGKQIGTRTAVHEIAHTLGVGTHWRWRELVKDGKWTGARAIAQLREFDGPEAILHADRQHFWPYGLNYDRELKSEEDYRRHVMMVQALREDMGLDEPRVVEPAAGAAEEKEEQTAAGEAEKK